MRRVFYALALAAAFGAGAFVAPIRGVEAQPTRPDLAALWRAWDLAHERFVYRDALVAEKLVQGAVRGMVDALGDEGHTRYLSPEDVRIERSARNGRFDGIGAEVGMRGGKPIVIAPIEGSPAERAGLRAGDVVIAVDGDDVTMLSLSELIAKVRGPRGAPVTLTVIHLSEPSPVALTIVRDEIRLASVSWAMIPGTDLAHVRINRFSGNTNDELRAAIEAARTRGSTGLILDLRNNPGGILNQAVAAASQFLPSGNVLVEEMADGSRKEFPVAPGGVAKDLPIAVLINRGSASASEIFAGAMQDHARGAIVGEKSFGTGTVLTPLDLPDGGQLYLGIAQWLTPNGRVIRRIGIKPDLTVTLPNDVAALSPREVRWMSVEAFREHNDTQLLGAVESLGARNPRELAPAA